MRSLLAILTVAALLSTLSPQAAARGSDVGQRIEDGAITALVKSKLVAARAGNFASIDVDTSNGVVRLAGSVPTDSDRAEAERLARGTNGVQQVVNELRVEPRAAGREETAGSASPASGDFRGRHTMTGQVTAVDADRGHVDLQTGEGTLRLHFPPASLRDVQPGDTLTVELAMKPNR